MSAHHGTRSSRQRGVQRFPPCAGGQKISKFRFSQDLGERPKLWESGNFALSGRNELEEFWADNVQERDKRRMSVMVSEIVSARTGALRTIKPNIQADIESAARIGAIYYPSECLCSPAYQYPRPGDSERMESKHDFRNEIRRRRFN